MELCDVPELAARVAIDVASSLTWIRETRGNNRGEAIDAMTKRCGLEPPQAWCAIFVSQVFEAFGKKRPMPRFTGCVSIGRWAADKAVLRLEPAPGAVFLLWSPEKERYAHTGFLAVPNGLGTAWDTVEGNTTDGKEHPDGLVVQGVFKRTRTFSELDRFVYWWNA